MLLCSDVGWRAKQVKTQSVNKTKSTKTHRPKPKEAPRSARLLPGCGRPAALECVLPRFVFPFFYHPLGLPCLLPDAFWVRH